jgi:dynein regulatry complex protein 1
VELESIEDAFLSERAELLRSNKSEVDLFFDKRKQAEMDYAALKAKREEEHQKEIEDQIVHDHEEYSKLKIKLETDIQTLEQQLEEMQATYQLNTEKLEYNYRVLTERDNENTQTLLQLKRKQGKLKETLSSLQSKYNETENRDKKKNEELTESYRSITKQYKDLQAKFRHFELADNKRFDELWAMHEEEVAACISKALTADELITTQQLGWEWEKPDLSTVRYGGGGGGGSVVSNNEGMGATSSNMPQLSDEENNNNNNGVNGEENSEAGDSHQQMLLEQKKKQLEAEQEEQDRMIEGAKMQSMMLLLVDEAQFLVDNKVKAALKSMSHEEAQLAQAESMLKALGCENEADMKSLIDFFFPLPKVDEDEDAAFGLLPNGGSGGGANGEGGSVLPAAFKELARMIQPEDVVKAIAQFVEAKKAKRAIGAANTSNTPESGGGGGGASSLSAAVVPSGGGGEGGALAVSGGGSNSVVDARREEKEYWVRAAGIIGSSTVSVWTQLEKALQEYNEILAERKEAIEEVEDLQAKNSALKELLQTYLTAGVNDDLIVPPSQSIHLDGF